MGKNEEKCSLDKALVNYFDEIWENAQKQGSAKNR
jgi:hypothetical protein